MDYFDYGNRRGGQINQDRLNAPLPGTPGVPGTPRTLEGLRNPSNIRIRRLPSGNNVPQTPRPSSQQAQLSGVSEEPSSSGRRRSSSEPQRFGASLAPPEVDLSRQRTTGEYRMPTLNEETPASSSRRPAQYDSNRSFYHDAREEVETPYTYPASPPEDPITKSASQMHEAGNAARANRGLRRVKTNASAGSGTRWAKPSADEYNNDQVDFLDLVDPEVRMIGTLNNVQNSLFVPDLGRLINRRPTYNLTQHPTTARTYTGRGRAGTGATRPPTAELDTIVSDNEAGDIELQPRISRRLSITSELNDDHHAVLPHGVTLENWTEEDKAELDDYVRHLMTSRKEGFKRSMRGFKQYVSKPLGLFVTVYATLVTLFGAAWVFFLIGWIYVGPQQSYIINIVDNLLVALFALIGDGLAPFRAVDTYHMCFIAKYHHMTWRLRKKARLPELVDHNDLPDQHVTAAELEDAIDKAETAEFSVLTPAQQRRLQYHQAKFSKAHTFYRPHETATHHAFPLRLLVAVVVLLDCHSLLQVALGSVTWSWDYHTRPQALTATILSCSISCNIAAGIVISVGDHRTRKKDVLERVNRQNLTEEALERMAAAKKSEEIPTRKSLDVRRTKEQVARANAAEAQEREMIEQETGPAMPIGANAPSVRAEEKKAQ